MLCAILGFVWVSVVVAAVPTIDDYFTFDRQRADSVEAIRTAVSLGRPLDMKPDEAQAFGKIACRNSTRSVFEFGCGGSTIVMGACRVERIASVDSSLEWINRVNSNKIWARVPTLLQMLYIDIGPIHIYGKPELAAHRGFSQYSEAIDYFHIWPDVVFVDGRFRIACILAALPYLGHESIVVVHDYVRQRGYIRVERYFDLVAQTGTLAVLRPKRVINLSDLIEDRRSFLLNPQK